MAKKEIFFFATKSDIFQKIVSIEYKRPVVYIPNKAFDSACVTIYNSIREIENIGISTSGNHQSESYFILDKEEKIQVREVRQESGEIKYFIDLSMNNKSIVFWSGGLYDSKHLVCGHIGTISDDPKSVDLYKYFTCELTKGFAKRGRYYLGPEAIELSKHIRLITMNINEPIEYDLTI